jgi:uncharacterized protein (TIGR00730 family)
MACVLSHSPPNRICVFCGSSSGADESYAEAARRLGLALVERGIGLVYGGGRVGLMGKIADSVLRAGGEVIGVMPRALVEREISHQGLTRLHVVGSMHERKALMSELSSGFVALPGGAGTLEEFFEVLTWAQLGIHRKPCGLLDVAGYWSHLLTHFDHMVDRGFMRPEHRALVLRAEDPDALLDRLANFEPPGAVKWASEGDI